MKRIIKPGDGVSATLWIVPPKNAGIEVKVTNSNGTTTSNGTHIVGSRYLSIFVPGAFTQILPATVTVFANSVKVDEITLEAKASSAGTPGPRGPEGPAGPQGVAGTAAANAVGLVSGVQTVPATTPVKAVRYASDASGPDLFATVYDPNNSGSNDSTLWTSWFNERGLFRLQQSNFTKWDVPLRIFGPSDNSGFGSNIIEVHKRRVSGTAEHVFGVSASGRVRSSLYAWTAIPLNTAKFSNDGTGDYDTAQVRWLTDDVLELRGAVVVAGGTLAVGDVIGTLPEGMRPSKIKRVAIGNATGAVNMSFVYPDGRIVNQRASASGAGWISLDNIRLS